MDLQSSINKLKEAIYIKKGAGVPFDKEAAELKTLEGSGRAENSEQQECRAAMEKKGKDVEEFKKDIQKLKEKLVAATKEWRAIALVLFRTERSAEDAFNEYLFLCRQAGINIDRRASIFPKTIHFGSTRVWWAEDELNPLHEGFRLDLILDNKDYYQKKRPGRRNHKPAKSENVYIPEQAADFIARGLDMPRWMRDAHEKYMAEQAKKGRS